MKPKGLLISVALLAVLGGLVFWSNKSQAAKEKEPSTKEATTKLLTIPDDQFQELKIKKVTNEVIDLKRGDNNKWRMAEPQNPPADNDTVSSMTSSLGNLTADKVVDEKATDLKQSGL